MDLLATQSHVNGEELLLDVPFSAEEAHSAIVYKSGGRIPQSEQLELARVTLTSIVAKVLEFLVLELLQYAFIEAGLPHVHVYKSAGVSCAGEGAMSTCACMTCRRLSTLWSTRYCWS